MAEARETRHFVLRGQAAAHLREDERHQVKRGELRRESLRGSHADLGTGARDVVELGVMDQSGRRDIADRERHLHAKRLCVFQRGKRI